MYTEHPPRAEYSLTARGEELRTVVRSLSIWGAKHLPGERMLVHERCGEPIEMAYRCAHCDETLALADIAFRAEAAPKRRRGQARASVRRTSRPGAARPDVHRATRRTAK